MAEFDHEYVNSVIERLSSIPEDAQPRWGAMNRGEMIAHLAGIVRHSMGKEPQASDVSNWLLRNIVGPLTINGWVPIPKNLKLPGPPASVQENGDLESFHALLEEYLRAVETGEMRPSPHPAFGEIGVDGWAKMHYRHFEHHLRQFGV